MSIRNITHELLSSYGFAIAGMTSDHQLSFWKTRAEVTSDAKKRRRLQEIRNALIDIGWMPIVAKNYDLTYDGLNGNLFGDRGGISGPRFTYEYKFFITDPVKKVGVDLFVMPDGSLRSD